MEWAAQIYKTNFVWIMTTSDRMDSFIAKNEYLFY